MKLTIAEQVIKEVPVKISLDDVDGQIFIIASNGTHRAVIAKVRPQGDLCIPTIEVAAKKALGFRVNESGEVEHF